jgi:hypothetical protein
MEELLCNIAIGQIPQGFPKETFFLLTNWELIIMAWQQTLTQGTVSAPTPYHISFYCFASLDKLAKSTFDGSTNLSG